MKQFILAAALIAAPVAAFSAFEMTFTPAQATAAAPVANLGDLSSLKAIVLDVQTISKTGDFVAAQARITDFESRWDQSEAKLRPLNGDAWGVIDDAADAALHALRSKTADAAKITTTLAGLVAALDNPYGADGGTTGVRLVSGVAVSDATGHPLACEVMLKSLLAAIDSAKIKSGAVDAAKEFLSKATERCNADDDMHSDEFSARGLALVAG